jgi:hypothetical protein
MKRMKGMKGMKGMVLSAKGAGMGDRRWVMGIHIGAGEFNPIGLRGKVITDGR